MIVVGAFAAGVAGGLLLWWMTVPAFGAGVFARENFRGRPLPTAVGLLVALAAVVADAVLSLAVAGGYEPEAGLVGGVRLVTVAALGFALLGLLDDLAGAGESGGFRGHLRSLASGRLTTGAIKLFGGAAVAVVVVVSAREPDSLGRVLADGALVALAANLGNLFDRAPGRTTKVALLSLVLLVLVVGAVPELAGVALVVGAGAGLLPADLGERLMLGDAGANVLGAALGLGVVLTCAASTRTVVLVVVALLNLASERVSFSRVIGAVAPLRAADRWGRQP
jgi:UDP-N-acetylmuramyl pentapeptide phosphotransferase/UDP-N-acetylglucosamine-1-phosphate transferase